MYWNGLRFRDYMSSISFGDTRVPNIENYILLLRMGLAFRYVELEF